MSEEVKTLAFLTGALVTGIAAFVVSREAPQRTAAADVGTAFVQIDDPLRMQRLKVVTYDSETGKPEPFEVGKVSGVYCIPSHENYPADAQEHLAQAVNFVNNVQILDVVDDSPARHRDFGVLDPLSVPSGEGQSGVGMRVTMSDEDGKNLADFVIGNPVKGATGQRYVRRADKDQVYTVQIDPSKLSTQFGDWIERDLLKMDVADVSQVAINDYSAVVQRQLVFGPGGPQIALATDLDMKSAIDLAYDQEDFQWELEKLITFGEDNQPVEQQLGANQELNTSKLNELKFALDDLEIVDVRRKDKALGENFQKAVMENPGAIADLEQRGFFFQQVQGPQGSPQFVLLSNNGEINVGLKTGVEYVLRFGDVAGADRSGGKPPEQQPGAAPAGEPEGSSAPPGEEAAGAKAPGGETADGGEAGEPRDPAEPETAPEAPQTKVLRYLFVMTQTNPALIDPPQLQEVPPETPPADPPAPPEGQAQPAGEEGPGEPAGAAAPAAAPDAAQPADAAEAQPTGEEAEADAAEEAPAEAAPAEEAPAEEAPAEDPAQKLADWKEKRTAIIQENERQQKAYDEKIAQADQRVKELNERFAAWYYVIDDQTYQKIHLSREDIIQEKEPAAEEAEGQAAGAAGETPQDDLQTFDQIKQSLEQPAEP